MVSRTLSTSSTCGRLFDIGRTQRRVDELSMQDSEHHPQADSRCGEGYRHVATLHWRNGVAKRAPHQPAGVLGDLGRLFAKDPRTTSRSCPSDHGESDRSEFIHRWNQLRERQGTWMVFKCSNRPAGKRWRLGRDHLHVNLTGSNQVGTDMDGNTRQRLEWRGTSRKSLMPRLADHPQRPSSRYDVVCVPIQRFGSERVAAFPHHPSAPSSPHPPSLRTQAASRVERHFEEKSHATPRGPPTAAL